MDDPIEGLGTGMDKPMISTGSRKRSESYTNVAVDVIRDRTLDLTLEPGKGIDDKLQMK